MTIREIIDFVNYRSKRPFDECENYEIIIAGHPGEIGTTLNENSIVINDDDRKIIIWI